MPGPAPKHSSTRARRNKTAGAKTLTIVHNVAAPKLPAEADVAWHKLTVKWWAEIWASPMAPEWDSSDIHGLYILAMLVNAFWYEPSQALAAEIRLQRQQFGLTPLDRRRLQWEIDRGEAAALATQKRQNEIKPKPAKKGAAGALARGPKKKDPRQLLAN